MRLVVISDTHGLHNRIQELPEGDVLIHAGSFMNSGYDPEGPRVSVPSLVLVFGWLKGLENLYHLEG